MNMKRIRRMISAARLVSSIALLTAARAIAGSGFFRESNRARPPRLLRIAPRGWLISCESEATSSLIMLRRDAVRSCARVARRSASACLRSIALPKSLTARVSCSRSFGGHSRAARNLPKLAAPITRFPAHIGMTAEALGPISLDEASCILPARPEFRSATRTQSDYPP